VPFMTDLTKKKQKCITNGRYIGLPVALSVSHCLNKSIDDFLFDVNDIMHSVPVYAPKANL